jgi:hypothetical protein
MEALCRINEDAVVTPSYTLEELVAMMRVTGEYDIC